MHIYLKHKKLDELKILVHIKSSLLYCILIIVKIFLEQNLMKIDIKYYYLYTNLQYVFFQLFTDIFYNYAFYDAKFINNNIYFKKAIDITDRYSIVYKNN